MVGPVAVHDRDSLDACSAPAALRDIGDARIEDARRSRNGSVGQARTFVRRSLPVAGIDDEALPRDLAALLHVVDVAAERNALVGARLDESHDQEFRPVRAPFDEAWRG